MMILEGKKYEEIYEKSKKLPNPADFDTEDEKVLYTILAETIPSDIKRWRNILKNLHGVSEETTTGVHRLY